jgi:hypothetical protein
VSAYLVVQGLAIVLLADLGLATVFNGKTTVRKVVESAGWWTDGPTFENSHSKEPRDDGRT